MKGGWRTLRKSTVQGEVIAVATACIVNVNNIGVLLAEHLKSRGLIEHYEVTNNARVCMEFNGVLTIAFEDYMTVHPLRDHIEVSEAKLQREENAFNRWIQSEIIRTLRGGEVIEYIPRVKIAVKSTEKTEIICVRVTAEEKKRIEEEAETLGLTLSELIRSKIAQR